MDIFFFGNSVICILLNIYLIIHYYLYLQFIRYVFIVDLDQYIHIFFICIIQNLISSLKLFFVLY